MRSISAYTDIASCVWWFDSLGGLTLSGSELVSWADQSGAGIALPATTANAAINGMTDTPLIGPTYSASNAEWSGKPSLTWGAGNTVLDTPVFAADVSPPFTFLLAAKWVGPESASGRYLFAGPGTITTLRRCQFVNTSSTTRTGGGIVEPYTMLPVFGPSYPGAEIDKQIAHGPMTVPFIFCGSANAAGDIRLHVNRLCVRRTHPPGTMRTHCGIRFGHSATATFTDSYWIGDINAFVAWNRFLSDGEALTAIDLMARRQGVSLGTRTAKTRTTLPAPGAVGGRAWIL